MSDLNGVMMAGKRGSHLLKFGLATISCAIFVNVFTLRASAQDNPSSTEIYECRTQHSGDEGLVYESTGTSLEDTRQQAIYFCIGKMGLAGGCAPRAFCAGTNQKVRKSVRCPIVVRGRVHTGAGQNPIEADEAARWACVNSAALSECAAAPVGDCTETP